MRLRVDDGCPHVARALLSLLLLSGAACLDIQDVGVTPAGDVYLDGDAVVFLDGEAKYYPEPDLNGDGDWDDRVVHLYRISDGSTANLGIASVPSRRGTVEYQALADGILAVAVFESFQGGEDLNGDGDISDGVLHVYDVAKGQLLNLGVGSPAFQAGSTFFLDERRVAYLLHEAEEDLNGDGDLEDEIWHVYDVDAGTTVGLGLASWFDDPAPAYEPSLSWMREGRFAFPVDEAAQGQTDLNGDGDVDDRNVLHVWDSSTGVVTNTGLAAWTDPILWGGNEIVFLVSEQQQGEADLNGDGDASDHIVHVFDLATDTAWSTGLATFGDREFARDGPLLAVAVDTRRLHVYDLRTRNAVDLGLGVYGFDLFGAGGSALHRFLVDAEAGRVFFAVDERYEDADLNGNGRSFDLVLHVYDTRSGVTTNLGLGVIPSCVDGNGRRFAFSASEAGSGLDLNLDGDLEDSVLHVYDANHGLTSLGIEADSLTVEDSTVAFRDPGIGLRLYDFETRTIFETELESSWIQQAPVVRGYRTAFVEVGTGELHVATILGPSYFQDLSRDGAPSLMPLELTRARKRALSSR